MSQVDEETVLSETEDGARDSNNVKLVPIAESIRYRKRAQSAEKKMEVLSEQLAQAKSQVAKLTEQLSDIATEQKLMRKLAAAGTVDLETAVLIAKTVLPGQSDASILRNTTKDEDVDEVIEQLKREKQYLFGPPKTGGVVMTTKTAGAKDRMANSQTILERAAKKAATTGNRTDLQEYLRLRRNFI